MKIRRSLCFLMCWVAIMGCLCINVGAVTNDAADSTCVVRVDTKRASGSFTMSIPAHGKMTADREFPLEAGETVRINASYSPDASVDFGLVDPNGIFHYFNVTRGSIDKTIQVSEAGNYYLAVRNNSNTTVRVSGFVRY